MPVNLSDKGGLMPLNSVPWHGHSEDIRKTNTLLRHISCDIRFMVGSIPADSQSPMGLEAVPYPKATQTQSPANGAFATCGRMDFLTPLSDSDCRIGTKKA